MPRKPKPKPQAEAPKSFDDVTPFDSEAGDEDPAVPEPEEVGVESRSRDWRDVERYKEMRQLRRLVDDDLDVDFDEPRLRRGR